MAVERGDYRAHLHWTDWDAWRQLWGQWCHGSAAPPGCHTATYRHTGMWRYANVPLSCSLSLPHTKVPHWLIYFPLSGWYPKYLRAALLSLPPADIIVCLVMLYNGLLMHTTWSKTHNRASACSFFFFLKSSPVPIVAVLTLHCHYYCMYSLRSESLRASFRDRDRERLSVLPAFR